MTSKGVPRPDSGEGEIIMETQDYSIDCPSRRDRSHEEIETLKVSWMCGKGEDNIEDTAGFEPYYEELRAWRIENQASEREYSLRGFRRAIDEFGTDQDIAFQSWIEPILSWVC